ncbi:MAG: hypothetical protein J1F61_00845 [Clostridiales bacterium]|nr:hypothetical protein [Clostridiales bacterium]
MEENILSLIAKAESEAAAKKAQAQTEAAEIIAAAEKKAQEISKSSDSECALLREKTIKDAEEKAALNYEKAIADSYKKAKEYADSHLERAEGFVLEIVGRLTK